MRNCQGTYTYRGEFEKIRRLQPHEPHKTLGCYISVNMSQEEQLEVVRGIITEWKNKIQASPLSSEDKIYAYKTRLEKNYFMYFRLVLSLTNSVPNLIAFSARHYLMPTKSNAIVTKTYCTHRRPSGD